MKVVIYPEISNGHLSYRYKRVGFFFNLLQAFLISDIQNIDSIITDFKSPEKAYDHIKKTYGTDCSVIDWSWT